MVNLKVYSIRLYKFDQSKQFEQKAMPPTVTKFAIYTEIPIKFVGTSAHLRNAMCGVPMEEIYVFGDFSAVKQSDHRFSLKFKILVIKQGLKIQEIC
jgi:hypothetical protein